MLKDFHQLPFNFEMLKLKQYLVNIQKSTTVLHPIHELGNAINTFNSNIYFFCS